jgi:hypothetical protein
MMTPDEVQQVAERLRQAGEAVNAQTVRQALGYGSVREIFEHLRTLEGEGLRVAAAPVGNEDRTDAPQAHAETAVAVLDDTPLDLVQAAEGALQRAQERLAQAETRVPELERQLADIRSDMHRATLRHLTLAFEVGRGMLSDTDPELKASEADMWQAHRRHRDAQEQRRQAPQMIAAAQGGIVTAQRQLFLAQQYPELLQELADVEAQKPEGHGGGEHDYRAWVVWKQQVAAVRARVDEVIAQAGL